MVKNTNYLSLLGGKEVCLELRCPMITKQWQFLVPSIIRGPKMRQADLCNANNIYSGLLTSLLAPPTN